MNYVLVFRRNEKLYKHFFITRKVRYTLIHQHINPKFSYLKFIFSEYIDKKEIVNKNCQLCWANIGRVLLHGLERKTFLKRRKSLQYFYALRLVVRHTMV